jgi:hypothetical protein
MNNRGSWIRRSIIYLLNFINFQSVETTLKCESAFYEFSVSIKPFSFAWFMAGLGALKVVMKDAAIGF